MSISIPKNNNFLVFSDDWGEHPSSCQHIFKNIAIDNSVVWVNTVGLRQPSLSINDIGKAYLKLFKMINRRKRKGKSDINKGLNITVEQPFMLPFPDKQWVRRFNRKNVVSRVRQTLFKNNIKSPIMIITSPNACDFIGFCGESKVIYYCVDDYSNWQGMDKNIVLDMEISLIKKADVLVATSQSLLERMQQYGREGTLLTHGVDLDLFSKAISAEHGKLDAIPSPRVGYFGLFDGRNDKKLIKNLARQMPDVSFVITGSIDTDISELKAENNIFFTGSIPYNELPQMAKGYDLCMLPYKVNELTNAIQPLKIKEYLATGKPVISSPIAESLKLQKFVEIAGSVEDWENVIRSKFSSLSLTECKERDEFLKNESWQVKSQQFINLCTT